MLSWVSGGLLLRSLLVKGEGMGEEEKEEGAKMIYAPGRQKPSLRQ